MTAKKAARAPRNHFAPRVRAVEGAIADLNERLSGVEEHPALSIPELPEANRRMTATKVMLLRSRYRDGPPPPTPAEEHRRKLDMIADDLEKIRGYMAEVVRLVDGYKQRAKQLEQENAELRRKASIAERTPFAAPPPTYGPSGLTRTFLRPESFKTELPDNDG